MRSSGVHSARIVGCQIADCVEPAGISRRRIPSVDVVGHGPAHHGHGFRDFGVEIQRLEHGVDEVGVSVDEPQSEGVVEQDFVEHVAVHRGIIRVPCPIDEVVVDAGSEEAKPCIRIVHQIPPRLIGRCAESFDVVQAPSQPQPIGVLGVRFKDKVVDVVFDIKVGLQRR